jgi:hypothetical protein
MSKRKSFWKRNLALLGGTSFALPFLGGPASCTGNVRNADLVGFYQAVGGNSIGAVADSTANIVGSDFNDIVIRPSAGFLTGVWDNYIERGFPTDPTFGSPFRE